MEGVSRATGILLSNANAAASEPCDPEMLENAKRYGDFWEQHWSLTLFQITIYFEGRLDTVPDI